MKQVDAADEAVFSGGLAKLYEKPFYIERKSVAKPSTMKAHQYHNCYEIYYLYSGERLYFIEDKTYHVKRGSLVLVKPYEIHSTMNYGKSGYDRCLISFKHSFVAKLEALMPEVDMFACFGKGIHLITLSNQEQSFVEALFFSMMGEYKSRAPGYEAVLKTGLAQLLLVIARHASDTVDMEVKNLKTSHKTVSEVAAYINSCYHRDITLNTISEKFFISSCYFSRVFKRETGVAFSEYLNGVRVKEAQRLLSGTEMSIGQIAEMVGYKSATHFGRVFLAIAGMPPSEYRRIMGDHRD